MRNIVVILALCGLVCVWASTEHVVKYDFHPLNGTDNLDNHTDHDNHTAHDGHHEKHKVHIVEWKFDEFREHFIFTVVVLLAGLSKVGFHYTDKLASLVPESCLLIIMGILFGVLFLLAGVSEKLPEFFTPATFFHFLLPPIILEAAFSLYDRTFLHNIGSILIYSVIGTCLSAFTIGLCLIGLHSAGAMEDIPVTSIQLLVFSSLIVAVDPVAVLAVFNEVGVNRVLYFLVFGESLLNDGVTVVLYHVLQSYNKIALGGDSISAVEIVLGIVKFLVVCIGGLCIGAICGIWSSILTKYTNKVKVVEPVSIFGMAYLAFILSEMFHFSGIISMIACGLFQVAYAFNNLNRKSCISIKYFTRVMSTITEIIIFMFLGLLVVRRDHEWKTGFILWSLFLCIIVRFLYTYLLSVLINRFDTSRVRKISYEEMFIMSYGGLRGAVCFSLVALLKQDEFPTKNLFITTTLVIIFFTVFVQGSTIKPLVTKLRVKLATEKEPKMYDELNCKVTDHLMAGMEEIVGYEGNFYLMEKMKRFQDLYLRKYLLKDPEGTDEAELLQYYEKVVMKEHYKNLQLCGAKNIEPTADMRKIDSSAMLLKLASKSGAEDPEEEEEEEVTRRVKSKHSPSPQDFRKLMESHAMSSRMMPPGMFDRNMALRRSKYDFMQQLQNKRHCNMKLQKMKSISRMPQRALSWSEDDSDVCFQRGSGKSNQHKTRSATVDFTPASPERLNLSHDSQLMDTVFEDDETEGKPLLEKEVENKSANDSMLSQPAKTGVTVINIDNDHDTICVDIQANKNLPKGEQKEEDTTKEQEEEDSKLDSKCSRKNSGHVLMRQGAMDDIQMKRLSKTKSQ